MATATEQLEFWVTLSERDRMMRAAELVGESVTSFARTATQERADRIIGEYEATTTVPADFFDAMMAALDKPDRSVASLTVAAERWRAVVDHG
jgi:uncharacterized protein (DUF1778 family)